jgi:hypothetical protein
MNAGQAGAVAPRVAVVPDGGSPAGRAGSAARTVEAAAAALESLGPALGAALGSWRAASAGGGASASWLVAPAAARAAGGSGYARAASPSTPAAKGEWSFLSDASLSVEDKLALFMQAVQRKTDAELTQKMEDYRARYAEEVEARKKEEEGGGWLSTLLKVLIPPLALADLFTGGDIDKFIGGAVKALGGPLLAALATAVGLPWLAPAAMKAGAALGDAIAGAGSKKAKAERKDDRGTKEAKDAKGTSPSSKGKASGTAAKKDDKKADEAGTPDERLAMLEIQRLVDKQNQMFQLVSNVLKGMHETTMVAIQNLR